MIGLIFFFNDTATTEIYTLSLHDALPISAAGPRAYVVQRHRARSLRTLRARRSEEHTSELQSRLHLVCRLLLEKKNQNSDNDILRSAAVFARHSERSVPSLFRCASAASSK